jgi:CP family cyanate transporter-like MFS transporter
LLAGLFLASLALRPQLVGIGPLLATIQQSLGVSHAVAGLLSTAVVLCMGVFAPVAYVVSRVIGPRWTIAAALGLIAGFGVARAVAVPAAAVLLLTLPIGIGIAIAGSLMPLVIRESWPGRPVLGTAVYTTGISLGAAISAAVAVPLADALGSWRDPLMVFSLVTAGLLLAWAVLSRGYGARDAGAAPLPRLPLRSRTAWLLVGIFALVSITYYGINAWLPSAFTERGWTRSSAGAVLTVINAVAVPVTLLIASRGEVFGSRRFWLGAGATLQLCGVAGVILAPAGGWLWAVLIGAGIGLLFPSLMTMPLDVADRPADVGAMAAMMLGLGYTVSAVGPFLLGLVRDVAGSFRLAMWLIFAMTAVILLVAILTSQEALRRHPRRDRAATGQPPGPARRSHRSGEHVLRRGELASPGGAQDPHQVLLSERSRVVGDQPRDP